MTAPYYTFETNLQDRNRFTSVVKYGGSNKRYFSSIECEFYFGSKRFYDMVEFSFEIKEIPAKIYGYNSNSPDLIVPGRKEIEGAFSINFTKGEGFINFISEVEDSIRANKIENITTSCPNNKNTWGNKMFDILIGYGYYKESNPTYNATCNSLLGVIITGMSQTLDTTGKPILETYTFTAKDYIEKEVEEKTDSSDETKKESSNDKESYGYKIAQKRNKNDTNLLEETCRNNEETVGIVIDAVHNINNDKKSGEIKVEFDLYNVDSLSIKDAMLDITDQRVGSTAMLNLKEKSNKNGKMTFSCSLNTDMNRKIYNILKNEDIKRIQAKLQFKCDKLNTKTIKNSIYVYPGNNY